MAFGGVMVSVMPLRAAAAGSGGVYASSSSAKPSSQRSIRAHASSSLHSHRIERPALPSSCSSSGPLRWGGGGVRRTATTIRQQPSRCVRVHRT